MTFQTETAEKEFVYTQRPKHTQQAEAGRSEVHVAYKVSFEMARAVTQRILILTISSPSHSISLNAVTALVHDPLMHQTSLKH